MTWRSSGAGKRLAMGVSAASSRDNRLTLINAARPVPAPHMGWINAKGMRE
jgi:hypothetical protein